MKTKWVAIVALLASSMVFAAPQDEARLALQHSWAQIKYEAPTDQREKLFEGLVAESEKIMQQFPQQAEILIWRAIILSTYAGEKGGLGALGLVKEAKLLLEQSIELDPTALDGSAYTSLGSLYYQVPGWPIGFGSDKKARTYLQKALKINPDGIDSNFFYGDFLIEQNDKAQAKTVLQHALEAKNRPGRELADKGRRAEIETLLSTL
ncbi:tetratricopeptide repeat protein [uncultured Neptuniibacter sp.]|uniref:tetratricopeptide repeat protein n=1 Tax=uncultured Neptuniibacter sp. TaxID=502143 RepID=UPI002610AAD8|nr:tetratricopeptide repeat protein [uncultured Neptuniibacter sp.]